MSVSDVTNEEIISVLEQAKEATFEELRTIIFSMGNTFYFWIKASAPKELLENLIDYDKFKIEIYYWHPQPPVEELKIDPIELDANDKKYIFIIDVKYFPHVAINPAEEQLFKEQSWSKHFSRSNSGFGYRSTVNRETLCDIIRYHSILLQDV